MAKRSNVRYEQRTTFLQQWNEMKCDKRRIEIISTHIWSSVVCCWFDCRMCERSNIRSCLLLCLMINEYMHILHFGQWTWTSNTSKWKERCKARKILSFCCCSTGCSLVQLAVSMRPTNRERRFMFYSIYSLLFICGSDSIRTKNAPTTRRDGIEWET